jgi:hypothetical protein
MEQKYTPTLKAITYRPGQGWGKSGIAIGTNLNLKLVLGLA